MVGLQMVPHLTSQKTSAFGDLKIISKAPTLELLFAKSALRLTEEQFDPQYLAGKIIKKIKINAQNQEELFYQFLSELLFLKDTERFLGKNFFLKISSQKSSLFLEGKIEGGQLTNQPGASRVEAKGITWHKLKINKTPSGWHVSFVVDI